MATYLTINQCLSATGYDYIDLLSLTGVFGIHDKAEFFNLSQQGLLTCDILLDNYGYPVIDIKSPKIYRLTVQIKTRLNLYVELFRLNDAYKGGGLGFKRLIKQVEAAKMLGFEKITLWAYGDYSQFPIWDGYIIWGKYGFSMEDQSERDKFIYQMAAERLSHCQSVNQLVKIKEGTALWKYIGSSWHGEFKLQDGSNSLDIFTEFGTERNLF